MENVWPPNVLSIVFKLFLGLLSSTFLSFSDFEHLVLDLFLGANWNKYRSINNKCGVEGHHSIYVILVCHVHNWTGKSLKLYEIIFPPLYFNNNIQILI